MNIYLFRFHLHLSTSQIAHKFVFLIIQIFMRVLSARGNTFELITSRVIEGRYIFSLMLSFAHLSNDNKLKNYTIYMIEREKELYVKCKLIIWYFRSFQLIFFSHKIAIIARLFWSRESIERSINENYSITSLLCTQFKIDYSTLLTATRRQSSIVLKSTFARFLSYLTRTPRVLVSLQS